MTKKERRNETRRARYAASLDVREKAKMQVRAFFLFKKYGLTLEDYDRLLIKQNGQCAICGVTPYGNRKFLDVDHDHKTGKVRGLLCTRCNQGIERLDVVANWCEKATAYLLEQV